MEKRVCKCRFFIDRGCLNSKKYRSVIPTKVEIHFVLRLLDSCFHGNDAKTCVISETAT